MRVVENPAAEESAFFFHRVNRLQAASPPIAVEIVAIPPVYEIDTQEDLALLTARWDAHAKELEEESLRYWMGLRDYPAFTVDKEALWKIDAALLLEHIKEDERILEMGAGLGRLIEPALAQGKLSRYSVIEPNPHWAQAIADRFVNEPRVRVFPQTVADYVAQEAVEQADVALGFGWATYLIHDGSLHRCLSRLPASKLLLKAPEPPQERFARLRVDHYSRELGTRYISLYRSASETCRLVRNAGWIVRELRRNLYPDHLESAYGSRTFLIVAERP
ncbi:MAG: hypothetical protein HYZ00_02355 [Candidatus Hydrogenedentes bacterium]|nr:hypothetical protein [Candidatus Hydrogenedentota bacterium]